MTRPIQYNDEISTGEIWKLSLQWVSVNHKLIRQFASPYFKHMAADRDDLYQEAAIAAYKAFINCHEKGEPNRFVPYFRVIFKTNCLKMASGVRTIDFLEDYQFTSPEEEEEPPVPEKKKIEEALNKVTERQRKICVWLLQQQEPVKFEDISKQFKVSRRHAFRMMSNIYERISQVAP
ncbi:MAG: sigma-70 family RNA polymerase sigma factor [Desulfobulbaceae bacterium]|nr:sigma-70 family RNA polymerase sigma factor [Desulfobulbaceae bacterium]